MPNRLPRHYWLGSCEVMFSDAEGNIGQRRINTLLINDNQYVIQKDIGHIQQMTQVRLMKELSQETEVPQVKILDVYVQAISYLGKMTQGEFTAGYEELAKEQQIAEANNILHPGGGAGGTVQ